MVKKYDFGLEKWNNNDFIYVYSPASKAYKEFIQEQSCIVNSFNEEINDFDYISMVTKGKYTHGVKISTKCSFEKYGAPLIVLTNDISKNLRGESIYGTHFEIVPYENGCNVWKIVSAPERVSRPIISTALVRMEFKVEAKIIIDLGVEVKEKSLLIRVNDTEFQVENNDIPESFQVGITACEGINRFFELVIED